MNYRHRKDTKGCDSPIACLIIFCYSTRSGAVANLVCVLNYLARVTFKIWLPSCMPQRQEFAQTATTILIPFTFLCLLVLETIMVAPQQNGTQKGTWGSVLNGVFAVFLYGGLTYLTWGRGYWIPTVVFVPLLLIQCVGLMLEFSKTATEIAPLSPWATKEERAAWDRQDRLRQHKRS